MKKYRLTDITKELPDGTVLSRIEALKDFADVRKGEYGGWVESEGNLSQHGNCWIYDNAAVTGRAVILDHAKVHGVSVVTGGASIRDHAEVSGISRITEKSVVCDHARVSDSILEDVSLVEGHACAVQSDLHRASIAGDAVVEYVSLPHGETVISDHARVRNVELSEGCSIIGDAIIGSLHKGSITVGKNARICSEEIYKNIPDNYGLDLENEK